LVLPILVANNLFISFGERLNQKSHLESNSIRSILTSNYTLM
jgi:hypothetical protein